MNCELRLVHHGIILVVLGLLSGFATILVPAPNMALAAHTIGIIQGTLAIALAFLWPALTSNGYRLTLTRLSILIGFYCNWLGALLAGVWSAKKMAIVSGSTMPDTAVPWQEIVVAVLLNASILVLVGFVYLAYVVSKVIADAKRA
jgi:hydroxylaminobenzene mutase